MQGDQIEVLIQQAASGNAEAFGELVLAFGRDLRLMIAAHAGAAAAVEQLEIAVWSAARQQLGQYRGEIPFAEWLAGLARSPLARHLEDADRVAVYAQDALAHQVAQQALTALEDDSEHGVRELSGRVAAMPETTRLLLVRHYREGQSVAVIATCQVVGESEIASALAGARAACDWRGIAKPPAASDRLLPALTEDWLSGTIDPDSFGLLCANLGRDLDRGVQFVRQVRVHLALSALLALFGREEARALARQAWGSAGDTSSRLLVSQIPPPRPSSAVRPPASDGRRLARKQSSSHYPIAHDEESRPSPLPWIIASVLVLAGVASLVAMNMRGGAVASRPPAPVAAPAQAGPVVPAPVDVGIGRILNHTGDSGLVRQGSRLSTTVGQSLHTGDGAVCVGPSAQLSLTLDAVGQINLRGDSALGAVGRKDGAWLAHLGSGRLVADVDHAGVTLMVLTPEARIEIAAAACRVTTGNGRTDVEVTRGSVRLVRPGDGLAVAVPTGRGAQLAERGAPTLTGTGVFVRGINLGGDPLAVERNPWLSQRQAEAAGLVIDAGAKPATGEVPGAGLDIDVRAMLTNGITASGGLLRLTQTAADGDYEVTLWLAGGSADGIALRLGGQSVAVGRPTAGGESWSRLGPYRVVAKGRTLEIALGGLRGQRLSGLALAAVGPGDGALPPLVVLGGVSDGGHAYVGKAVDLRAELSSAAGITRVEFWNGATRLGESTAAPWTVRWQPPSAGAVVLTARAHSSTGISASLPVATTVIPAFGTGLIRREWWTGVGGTQVAEAAKVPGFPAQPQGQADESEFSAPRDWGDAYVQRLYGFITPPLDGDYVFWVAADDEAELWLSEDDTAARRRRIAVSTMIPNQGTGFQEWERDPRQRSEPVRLQAGRRYYVEVIHKEGGGIDHVEVGWRLPDGVFERPIPGVHLSPPSALITTPPVAPVIPPVSVTTPPPPVALRFVTGINLGGDPVVVDGNKWLGHKQAEEANAAVASGGSAVVMLSDIEWATAKSANGDVHKNLTWENKPLTLRGVVFPKGLGVHAASEVTYALAGRYSTFMCDVGIDDETKGQGSALFRVFVDGQQVFDSGVVTHGSPAKKVKVSVAGGKELKLVVTDGGNGNDWDHSDWAGARLLRAGPPGGLAVKSGRKTVGVMNPKPAVEAPMRGMLTSSLVGTAKEGVAFNVRVPPGTYQVYLWVVETSIANARLFEVELEGESCGEIGALPATGWAKYGPFLATVEDGELNVVTKPKKGVPQLMGIAIFENVVASAPNLVPNFDFENGSGPWDYFGAACVSTGVHRGGFAGQATGSPVGIAQTIRGLQPNTTYTLTAWGRISSADDVAYIYAKNYGGEGRQGVFSSAAGYAQSSLVFTTGATNTSVELGLWKSVGTGSAWVDDFSLTASPSALVLATGDVLTAVPEAAEYSMVYLADLARLGVEVPYEVDDSAKITGAFDRIGYCLELQRPGGQVEWVWTAMDAFTSEVGKIAVPTVASNASFQQLVTNLTVASNVKDLPTGAMGDGVIEFWSGDYGPANTANIAGASNEAFDFGDQRHGSGIGNGYGCMQVHNLGAKQTVFALNSWRDGARADLGIGNSSGNALDWTFAHNAGTFSLKKLRVFVRPKR